MKVNERNYENTNDSVGRAFVTGTTAKDRETVEKRRIIYEPEWRKKPSGWRRTSRNRTRNAVNLSRPSANTTRTYTTIAGVRAKYSFRIFSGGPVILRYAYSLAATPTKNVLVRIRKSFVVVVNGPGLPGATEIEPRDRSKRCPSSGTFHLRVYTRVNDT